jgi:F-box/leucine-rich repeat protein 7
VECGHFGVLHQRHVAADKNLVKQGLVTLIELCDLRSIIARGVCIDDTVFDTINGHGANLIHLDLNRCVGISDAALSNIATACPKLQYLNVYGTAVSDEGMQDVTENCLDLRHVDLTDTNTGDDACVALGECCSELTYLACCAESTGILAIAEGCPKLQTLLNNCTSIGDHALIAVAKNCPELRVLHVAGTRSICDESLQYLGMYSKVSACNRVLLRVCAYLQCPLS